MEFLYGQMCGNSTRRMGVDCIVSSQAVHCRAIRWMRAGRPSTAQARRQVPCIDYL